MVALCGGYSTEANGIGGMVLAINLLKNACFLVNLKVLYIPFTVGEVNSDTTVIRGQMRNLTGLCGRYPSHMASETERGELEPPMRKQREATPTLWVGNYSFIQILKDVRHLSSEKRDAQTHSSVCKI